MHNPHELPAGHSKNSSASGDQDTVKWWIPVLFISWAVHAATIPCLTSDDCSDAIQAELNKGGRVELSPCEYKLLNGLSIGSNTSLIGAGRGSTVLTFTVDALPAVNTQNAAIVFVAATNAVVRSLTVDARKPRGNGIVLVPDGLGRPCDSITVSDCEIIGRESHHYHIWSLCGRNITIENNSVDGRSNLRGAFQGHEGIEVYGGYNVSVIGNRVVGINGHGFNVGSQKIPAGETRWPRDMDTSVRFLRIANNFSSGCSVGFYIGSNNADFLPMTQIHLVNNQVDFASDVPFKVTAATPTDAHRMQIDQLLIDANTGNLAILAQPRARLGSIRLGRNFGDVRVEGVANGVILRR